MEIDVYKRQTYMLVMLSAFFLFVISRIPENTPNALNAKLIRLKTACRGIDDNNEIVNPTASKPVTSPRPLRTIFNTPKTVATVGLFPSAIISSKKYLYAGLIRH